MQGTRLPNLRNDTSYSCTHRQNGKKKKEKEKEEEEEETTIDSILS